MARQIIPISRFQGISDSEKEGLTSQFLWARSMDYRTDPTKLVILPRTTKDSGTIVTDLILDGDRVGTGHYFYGDTGNIYKRTSAGVWTNEVTVADSHGNGMAYFGEDDYLYYPSDTVIGRYGPVAGTPTWATDFMGAQGGIPLNTASLDCELDNSEYATAADSVSLSQVADITIEGWFKHESLPAAGAFRTLVSKWDGLSDERSYTFEFGATSGYFGDGSDGALTIAADTTQAPIDSAATGTATEYHVHATNVAFAAGQKVLIHQTRGTNAGQWERNEISSYTAGTISLVNALVNTYTSGAQVIVLLEYTNVTVNSGKTWTAKAWDGTVGGILCFLASGTVTVTGSITATGKGFRGGTAVSGENYAGKQGEGTAGAGDTVSTAANGNGGGGGGLTTGSWRYGASGGGGGNGLAGTTGQAGSGQTLSGAGGTGGSQVGTADLTTLEFGGGGGSGGSINAPASGAGGIGGGIIFMIGATVTVSGTVVAGGNNGGNAADSFQAGGGGGSGGSILIKAQTATLGATLITAPAGSGGTGYGTGGGAGGTGRIHLDYYTSYTGTTTPTLDYTQDSSLVTNTTYQLRLSVTTAGTTATAEDLTKSLPSDPVVATWYHYAVSWDASGSLATFYVNGVSIGTITGTKTAIYNSTALFAIGARFNAAGAAEQFYDGKVDDIRLWSDLRTENEIRGNMESQLVGTEAGLVGYWTLNSDDDDITANNNDLTLVNTPTYDIADVPFAAPTTRQDLDQSLDTSGQHYHTLVAISEAAADRQSFVPTKDPQKSVQILVLDNGTGNWTVTVHDAQNRVIATKTEAVADVIDAVDHEFIFATPWRPVLGQTYHFHVTTTVADGTVTTTTDADLETVDFHTYYQFLVDDTNHPVEHFLDFLAIGNERYLAKWNGITYTPHCLTLPSGYHIRCLGQWREYLVIGTYMGSSLTDYEYGMLFFWDGVSDTYNFYRYVPQGAINSILSGDPMYFMAGYAGDFMKYDGGNPIKIRRMPNVKNSDTLSINRKALTMWRALVHIGFSSTSTSTGFYRGVYSWGTLHDRLPETLSFDYPLSLGITQSADLEVGMVMAAGTYLFTSWKNGSNYGMDVVKPSNAPYATATYESLITDANKIWAEKESTFARAYFKALVSGDSFTIKYKIDRESAWSSGTAVTTAGLKEARLPFPTQDTRYNEIQLAIDMTTSNTTSPEFYGIALDYDDLQHERRT